MRKLIPIFAAFAAALALLATGCGGGDDDDTVTKAEFIKRADKICQKVDGTQVGEFQAYTQKRLATLNRLSFNEREEKLAAAVYVPSMKEEIKELEALEVPPGEEQKVDEVFAEMNAALKVFAKDPTSYLEGGPSDPFNKTAKLAREYGFISCQEIT